MTIFPKTQDQWVALPVFPFKVWVLIAFPFYVLFSSYAHSQHVRYGTTELGEAVIAGYMLSVVVLLLGALMQSIVCSRGTAIRTLLYAVGSVLLVITVYHF